ncbi:ENV1 protein, partial [Tyrannus savana]|nr:ENV1 protein [Tyrannus savana]
KLHNGLEQRKKEKKTQQSWFESWHNPFPWLTPLLTTLAGPLITLLATLTFGPCILNKVKKFIRERVENIQLMTIKQNYENMSSKKREQSSQLRTTKEAV